MKKHAAYAVERTSSKIQDSSALFVSEWQHSYSTRVVDMLHGTWCYVSIYVHVACSICVVVDQQVVSTVVIKFTSTQKSQQKCIVSA